MFKLLDNESIITRILVFTILVTVLAGTTFSNAKAELLLNPIDDSYVYNQNPDTNYDGTGLYVGYSLFGVLTPTYQTYIKYDLSSVEIATGRSTFNFTFTQNSWELGNNISVSLYSVSDDSWNETTLTHNNSPAIVNPGSITLLETKVIAAGTTGLITYGSTSSDNPVGTYIESQRTGDGIASFLIRVTAASGGFFGGFAIAEDRENSQTPGIVDSPYLDMRGPTAVTLTEFTVSNNPSNRIALWIGLGISFTIVGVTVWFRRRIKI